MPDEWAKTTVGALITLEYGKALPERLRSGSGAPVFGSNGVVGWHDKPLVPGPGIIVGRKGTAGSVTWSATSFFPIDTTYWVAIKCPTTLSVRYAALLLEHCDLPAICAQTGVPGLNRDRVYEVPVTLPPLPAQRRIADLMEHLDTHLRHIGNEIVFVEQSRAEVIRHLLETVERSRPLFELLTPSTETIDVAGEGEYPLLGVLNRGRGLLLREPLSGAATKYKRLNVIRPNQVLYSKLKAFEGSCTVAVDLDSPRFASQEFPAFDCNAEVNPRFLRAVTTTQTFQDDLASVSKGMGGRRERVHPRDFLTLSVPAPPREVQDEWAAVVDSWDALLHDLNAEHARMRTLRSSALARLLSADYEIPESYDHALLAAS